MVKTAIPVDTAAAGIFKHNSKSISIVSSACQFDRPGY